MTWARRLAGLTLASAVALAPAASARASTTLVNVGFSKSAKAGTVAKAYASSLWTGALFGNGPAYSERNLSVHDGSLDMRFYAGQGGYVAFDPTGEGYAPTPGHPVHLRFSAQATGTGTGYGVAFLLWPKGDDARNGEFDVLEGDLDKRQHIYPHVTGDACRADGWCDNMIDVEMLTWKKEGWVTVDVVWATDRITEKVNGVTRYDSCQHVPVGPHALIMQGSGKPGATRFSTSHVLVGSMKVEHL